MASIKSGGVVQAVTEYSNSGHSCLNLQFYLIYLMMQKITQFFAKRKAENQMEEAKEFGAAGNGIDNPDLIDSDKQGSYKEYPNRDIGQSSNDINQSNRDIGQSNRDINQSNRDIGQSNRDIGNSEKFNQQLRGSKMNNGPSRNKKSQYAEKTGSHNELTPEAQQTLNDYFNQSGNDSQIYLIKEYGATYQGDFVNGLPEGTCICHFRDGTYYQGDFKEAEANGNGVYIFEDGSYYKGDFQNSKFHGTGYMYYNQSGTTYNGQWSEGLPEGEGEQTTGKEKYTGNFRNGLKSGKGVYCWEDGRRYEGNFEDGLMHGFGVITQQNSTVYKGNFYKGKKYGEGLLVTKAGSFKGKFQNDYMNGNGTFLWNDGKAYSGNFEKTKMHGRGAIYYPTNQVVEGVWEDGHSVSAMQIKNDPLAREQLERIKKEHQSDNFANPYDQTGDQSGVYGSRQQF